MHRNGLANQPTSTSRDDGLALHGVWVASAVRCAPPANRPAPEERDRCLPFLERELRLFPDVRVMVVLGQFAYEAAARLLGVRPRPPFGHGVEVAAPGGTLILCSYHPSQQNTFTGKLTAAMLDAVFARARRLAELHA
jgi:uracil-DNA glycosylase family 4